MAVACWLRGRTVQARVAAGEVGPAAGRAGAGSVSRRQSLVAAVAVGWSGGVAGGLGWWATEGAWGGEAGREGEGVALRYLRGRTPRAMGAQQRMPVPWWSAAGATSRSMPRSSREYSTW